MKPVPFNKPSDILILTGSVGAGHISVARAMSEAIFCQKKNARVEILDLMTALSNIITKATKSFYLGSLKLSPKIYDLLFHQSSAHEWPLKILNSLATPFMEKRFFEILQDRKPQVLVSTYPLWDILAKKVWKKYSSGRLPFVTVITDSTNVHGSWTQGNADFYLVANDDTKTSLIHHGIASSRIKVFGYPVAHRFSAHHACADFKNRLNLSPLKKTLLLILSIGLRWPKIKKLIAAIQKSNLKKMQMVVVAAGEPAWEKKIKAYKWPFPVRITGWTNEMHEFIHAADIILTKAGGATVMECIESTKPMVIIDALPGQEIGNAALVEKYNLGVVLNEDVRDLENAIIYIFANEARIKKNLESQKRPRAAEDTAKFLLELLEPA